KALPMTIFIVRSLTQLKLAYGEKGCSMNIPMRIFVATGLYPPEPGGPATYTRLLEESLPARGFKVSVLPFRRVRWLPPGVRHAAYFALSVFYALGADIVYAQDAFSVGVPASLAAR